MGPWLSHAAHRRCDKERAEAREERERERERGDEKENKKLLCDWCAYQRGREGGTPRDHRHSVVRTQPTPRTP